MTPKKIPQYFLERATICEQLAEQAEDPKTREMMRFIASRWREMAADDERARAPRPTSERAADHAR